jgi:hypothetical protein
MSRWSRVWVPGIAGASAEPLVAHGECAEREFGDEDCAGCVEALDYGCVFVEGLMLEAARAPGGGIAFDGEQVFCAPGDAVQRAAVFAGGDFFVGFFGLGEGAVLGEGDDEVEFGVVALEAGEVHLGEGDGASL